MATTYMNMDLPVVEDTTGPEWAEMLNEALSAVVDSHDHTSGKGVPVPSSGININADLDFQQWAAINLESTQYVTQSAEPDGTYMTYFLDDDFYVVDGNGVSIRITENGAISAASFGGITGLVSPASASFATDTFTWLYDTGKYALMASGPLLLRRDGETNPNRIKVTPPTLLASGYDLTLPGALPVASAYWNVSSTGTVSFNSTALASSVDTASIQALAVTRAKMAAVGQQASSGSGTFSTASTSFVDVTNLNVSITTTGRPVVVTCIADTSIASGNAFGFYSYAASSLNPSSGYVQIAVTGTATTTIGLFKIVNTEDIDSVNYYSIFPPSSVFTIYPGAAGTYTFTVQARADVSFSSTVNARYMKLIAYEL